MLYAIVGMLVVILDQAVKYWVSNNIVVSTATNVPEGITTVIPDKLGLFSIVNVHNDGAAFSILSGGNARIYFIIITGVFVLAVIIALATNFISGRFGRWCMVIIAAGGIANCIDRVIYGYVQDMFRLDFMNFAVFNVADIFISVFGILFIIYLLFGGEKEEEELDAFDAEDSEEGALPAKERGRRQENFDEENSVPFTGKRGRQPALEQFEQYRAERAERQKAREEMQSRGRSGARSSGLFEDLDNDREVKESPVRTSRPASVSNEDPFAAWEQASSRVQARQEKTSAQTAASGARPAYTPRPASAQSSLPRASRQPAEPAPKMPARPVSEAPVKPASEDEADAFFANFGVSSSARPAAPAAPKAPAASAAPSRPAPAAPASSSSDSFDLDDILNEFR